MSLYGTTTVTHSIFVKGTPGANCLTYGTPDAIVSHGYNLSDDPSCGAFLVERGDVNNAPAGQTRYLRRVLPLMPFPSTRAPTPMDICSPISGAFSGRRRPRATSGRSS
jgi:hypothetical protein